MATGTISELIALATRKKLKAYDLIRGKTVHVEVCYLQLHICLYNSPSPINCTCKFYFKSNHLSMT